MKCSIRDSSREVPAVLAIALLSLHGFAPQSLAGDAQPSATLATTTAEDIAVFVAHADNYWNEPFPENETDPGVVLAGRLEDGTPLVRAAIETGRQFGLSGSLAEDLAFALIATRSRYRVDGLPADTRSAAIEALYRVLAANPRLTGAWGRLAVLIDAERPECDDRRFLDALFSQGIEYALNIYELAYCPSILVRAVAEAPDASSTLQNVYNASDQSPATRIALADEWRQLLLEEGAGMHDPRYVDASMTLMGELVATGMAAQALKVVDDLPPEVRDRVLVRTDADGDALRDYVVALLASGRASEAGRYLPELRRRESCADGRQYYCETWTALRMLIENRDAFDLLKTAIAADEVRGVLLLRLLAEYFESSGYPDLAAYYRAGSASEADWMLRETDDRPELLESLGERFLQRRTHYERLIAAALPEPAPTTLRGSGFTQPKTQTVFEENPALPEHASDGCRPLDESSAVQATEPLSIWPVRAEQCGDALVVLGLSQSLDPMGEISAGGYWLAVSHDMGRRWRQTYTGLRVYFPYVARAESSIPLLRDGLVRIHADVRELDVDSISFPPVALATLREESDVLLTAKLSDLQRDGDGDGLADIVERRLLLDSEDPDFDGDGIADGYDMQPNVPKGPLSERGAAFALVLEEMFGYERAAIVAGPRSNTDANVGQVLSSMAASPPVPASNTLFILADPSLLQGQLVPFRAIVITESQAQRLRDELGIFMPLELGRLWFSKDGRRALIQWSARWRGGVIYLEQSETGDWQKEVLSNWIT